MKAYWKLTIYGLRVILRDRASILWTILFPLIFLVFLGSLMDRTGSPPQFAVGLVLPDSSPASDVVATGFRAEPTLRVSLGSREDETEKLRAGGLRAVVVFPKTFATDIAARRPQEIEVLFDPSQQSASTAVNQIVDAVLLRMGQALGGAPPLLTSVPEPITDQQKRSADSMDISFIVPGILAMTIIQIGIFSAIPLIALRQLGVLRRLRATPLPPMTVIASQVTQRLVICLAQTGMQLTLAAQMFHFHIACPWPEVAALVVFGILTFLAIGAVIASIAKTAESAAPLLQMVYLPMIFLSGLFIPDELLPHTLTLFANLLPATYLADALRHVMLAAPSAHSFPTDLVVLCGWLVGAFVTAARLFKWE